MAVPEGVNSLRHRDSVAADANRYQAAKVRFEREQFRLIEKAFAFMMVSFPQSRNGTWAYPQGVDVYNVGNRKRVSIRGIYAGQYVAGPPQESLFFVLQRLMGEDMVMSDPDFPGCIMITNLNLKRFDEVVGAAFEYLDDGDKSMKEIRAHADQVTRDLEKTLAFRLSDCLGSE
ncbi:hypothetical protein HN709_00655 [Candidatus Peregrinibacteria bacterium]|jgi:hypothetical protein|nr:hypothetical protein [Candidatus Peregrinibacteria bacterium]